MSLHGGLMSLLLGRKSRDYIFYFEGKFFETVVCIHWFHQFVNSLWAAFCLHCPGSHPTGQIPSWSSLRRCFSGFSHLISWQRLLLLTTACSLKCAFPCPLWYLTPLVSLLKPLSSFPLSGFTFSWSPFLGGRGRKSFLCPCFKFWYYSGFSPGPFSLPWHSPHITLSSPWSLLLPIVYWCFLNLYSQTSRSNCLLITCECSPGIPNQTWPQLASSL